MIRNALCSRLFAQHGKQLQYSVRTVTLDAAEPHPDYYRRPKVGYYEEPLNVQITGYDFVVLEKYQSYLHKAMKRIGIRVENGCSVPQRGVKIDNLAFQSTFIEFSNTIRVYERNLIIKRALVTKLAILIDLIYATSPPGVSFRIVRNTPEEIARMYFHDPELDRLREELAQAKDTPLIGD